MLILGMAFLVLFGLADILRKVTQRREPGRKLAHVGTGILSLTFPYIFQISWPVYTLCGIFLVMLIISQRKGFWQGINGVKRETYGSVAFPLAVASLWWLKEFLSLPSVYALPLGILMLADPAAAIVGLNRPIKNFKVFSSTRSIAGTSTFFVVALATSTVLSWMDLAPQASWPTIVIVAGLTTFAETLSQRGWDNFWIPISGAIGVLFSTQIFGF